MKAEIKRIAEEMMRMANPSLNPKSVISENDCLTLLEIKTFLSGSYFMPW